MTAETLNTQQSATISSLLSRLTTAETLNTQQNASIATLQASVRTLQTQMTQVLASFQQLGLTDTALTLTPSGGNIALSALLAKLLNIEINILPSIPEMALRSLFGNLLFRIGGLETNVADISGVRLASEEAKSSAQLARDALQDVSGALLQLEIATRASDLSGVLVRVSALEQAPGFDATALEARLTSAEGALGAKADQSYVDSAVADKALASDLSALDTRVGSAESSLTSADGRLSALETAVPSKVAQADYDVYVASNDALVASKADASALASKADASAVALKEDIGRIHKIDMVTTDVSGVNGAYWIDSLGSVIGAIVAEGKVAELIFAEGAPLSHFLNVANEVAVGTAFRFKNSGNQEWIINLGSGGAPGPAIAIAVGELMTVVKTGVQAWKVL